ncbi:MAG: tyrosine-type recombinase/integrase [Desulfotomaculaceae bacterium]|nr:tyrosine-type recombinase/integrase [Desulfotomaculaceae bacterium]
MAGYYEKTKSGKYRLFASGGVGPNGKRKRFTKTIAVKSDRQAEKELAKFVASVETSEYVEPSRTTFKEFVEQQWLPDYAQVELAPKTLHRYNQLLGRIIKALGNLRLEQVRQSHLKAFYANLREEGVRLDGKPGRLSERTILHHHRLIASIFAYAIKEDFIATNPATKVTVRVKPQQADCYEETQLEQLLAAAGQETLKHTVLVNLAVFSGLRRGELMGLEWVDVGFEGGTITVRQSSQYVPGQGQSVKDPKTELSKRTISLPPFLFEMLKEYKREQNKTRLKLGDKWQNSDRLFTTWDGRPGHPEWPSQWFPKFIRRHNLPPIPFHSLRHLNATIMINSGVHAKIASARLGHSNVSTTLNIYTHLFKSADKDTADQLEAVYQNITGKKDIKKGQA